MCHDELYTSLINLYNDSLAVLGGFMYASTNQESNQSPTHFYFLLDRSGSMTNVRGDIVQGLNDYVSQQRRDLSVEEIQMSYLTLVQFDGNDAHEVHLHKVRLGNVKEFGLRDFEPRGSTPLYDAIAKIIRRAERVEEPENKVIIIMTDGEENASLMNDRSSVSELVKQKTEKGWTFVFLGANIEAFEEADKVGILSSNVQNFVQDSTGISRAFTSLAKASSAYSKKAFGGKDVEEMDVSDFFGDDKEAQRDFERRGSSNQQRSMQIQSKNVMSSTIKIPKTGTRRKWLNLQGVNVDVALERIRKDMPSHSLVVKIPVGSMVTADHRTDRVRVWYDPTTNLVTKDPMIG